MGGTMNSTGERRRTASARSLILFVFFAMTTTAFPEERIVATVNGSAITAHELEAAINRLIPQATFHGNVTQEKRDEFRDKALDDLIIRELKYQDALAKKIRPDKKFVKSEMEKIRKGFPSKQAYRAALEQAGYTENSLKARFEKDSVVKLVTEKTVVEPAKIGQAALREFYDKNPARFRQPDSVKLRIISFKDEKKTGDILARIKAGEDFGDIASRMSEDNYRIKGGDIGYIHRGRIYPAIEEAAFRLKQGEVSEPILTEGYWFIVKVEDKQAERQLSFDEAKEKLEKDLVSKRAKELMEQWIAELRDKAKIDVKPAPAADQEK